MQQRMTPYLTHHGCVSLLLQPASLPQKGPSSSPDPQSSSPSHCQFLGMHLWVCSQWKSSETFATGNENSPDQSLHLYSLPWKSKYTNNNLSIIRLKKKKKKPWHIHTSSIKIIWSYGLTSKKKASRLLCVLKAPCSLHTCHADTIQTVLQQMRCAASSLSSDILSPAFFPSITRNNGPPRHRQRTGNPAALTANCNIAANQPGLQLTCWQNMMFSSELSPQSLSPSHM